MRKQARASASAISNAYVVMAGVREGERPREFCFPSLTRTIWAREDARPPVKAARKVTQSHAGVKAEGRMMNDEEAGKAA